jgi:uncharacterized protein YfaS (alpha-2-macroglobulin family)
MSEKPNLSMIFQQHRVISLIPIMFLLIVLACTFPGLFPKVLSVTTPTINPTETPILPTATPQPLPPDVVEIDPPPDMELPLQGEMILFFNQPMERSSVEIALKTDPVQAQSLVWQDDSTLMLNPGPLTPESIYTITLGIGARSARGLTLLKPISFSYHTAGFLHLTQRLPEPNAVDIDPSSAIVASFNRPVVPLGADPASLLKGFSVNALNGSEATGKGEWVNTSTYIFYPQPALEGGKTYLVQINQNLTGIDGSPLEKADLWSFTTAAPLLVSYEPGNGVGYVRLDAKVQLVFNQPMDSLSVESNFRLLDRASKPVPGKVTWDDKQTVLTFSPDLLLERDNQYTLSLDGQAKANGGTPLGTSLQVQFHTTGKLAILSSNPISGGQKSNYASVMLYLNAPIPKNDFIKYIHLSPQVPDLTGWFNEDNLSLSLNGSFDPATHYMLVISPDLPDIWGEAMSEQYSLEFRTALLDPVLYLTSGSDTLFITPQDASLSAQVASLTRIPVSMGSIPLPDFITMLGPNGYDFRQNYHPADQRDWLQTLDGNPTRLQSTDVYVNPDRNPLQPGLYYLKFNLPQVKVNTGPFLLVSSNINLTFKLSSTGAFVWAVDLRTNIPLSGATVTIYDESGVPLAIGQTDNEGIFQGLIPQLESLYKNFFAVIGQPGQDTFALTMTSWNQGVAGWDFGISSDFSPPQLEAYLYTDRPIYRPGQSVNFRMVVRQAFNGRYSMPDPSKFNGKASLTLYGNQGQELAAFELLLSSFGTGHGEYQLPADIEPGYYRLASKEIYPSDVTFQVAEYRKPEINLQVTFPNKQILAGQKVTAGVKARYFFDAPAGNLSVHWTLYAKQAYFDLPGYQVGVEDTRWLEAYYVPDFSGGLGRSIAEGDGKTSPEGMINIDLIAEQEKSRQLYTLEVTTKDESDLPVSARATVMANPANYFIGVHPDSWLGKAGEQFGFDIQAAGWDKNPSGAHSMQAVFEKVIWIRQEPVAGLLFENPKYSTQYTKISSTEFSTDNQGQARLAFTPTEAGTYQLSISGDGARTEILLWVGGAGQAVWPNLPNQRLRLTADRDKYKPGETAKIFIPNPFGVLAPVLVTVERSIVLRHQVLQLSPGGSSFNLTLSADDAPNVFLSVTVLGKKENGQPDFRQGYLDISVDPSANLLNVTLTSQPKHAGPGDEVTFDIFVSDSSGTPAQGEFSLSLVDLAVLALADPNAPEIIPAFYGPQSLGVETGQALAIYTRRKTIIPPGLGGGGGEGVPSVIRDRFPDTAYWNAEITTDVQGRAHVSVTLPDSLTTWQVDLRGLTKDTRVGQATTQIISTKDLLVRPVTPRFFVGGDHIRLAAVAQNNTNSNLLTEVTLQANGIDLDSPGAAIQQVNIPAGGRVQVEWWGSVQPVETVDLIFSASSGNLQDVTRPSVGVIPVLHYTTPQTFGTSGMMDQTGENLELVSLPRSIGIAGGKKYTGSLRLEMSSSLAGVLLYGLDALEQKPYQCNEQVISRILSNLEIFRVLQKLDIETPDQQTHFQQVLDEGLKRLLARQNQEGGWGWWQGNPSDPYISAYALYGLLQLKEAGFALPEDILQKTIEYLRAGLVTPQTLLETWQIDRLAFIQFTLTQAGVADLAGLDALFQVRMQLNPWSKALLALSLDMINTGSDQARTLISDLESTAIRSSTGAHWEGKTPDWRDMQTPVSTSAIVVYALVQKNPTTPLLAAAVRYLVANRQTDGAWDSTFGSVWALKALARVLENSGNIGSGFDYSAWLNGSPVAKGQANIRQINPVIAELPIEKLYPDTPNALIIKRDPGSGQLYYTAFLNIYRPVDTVTPVQRGISVSRFYYPGVSTCSESACPPVNDAKAGELVRVRLTITLENDAYYLLVEDHLPAGSEILDTSLKTAQQGAQSEQLMQLFNPQQPFASGWGWWLFSQPKIFDDRIAWDAEYLPAGTYELTYTLLTLQPGEYRVLPARAWQFYFPDVYGNSSGDVFIIK